MRVLNFLRQWFRFRRIDSHRIPWDVDKKEIRLFMNVRNERHRLPHFLSHYRTMGVSRFFIVDNGSTDGTVEYLQAQNDVHIFVTHESYADADYGIQWMHSLLRRYGYRRWCLVVDADEFLWYSDNASQLLPAFIQSLDEQNADCLRVLLLDVYAKSPLLQSQLNPNSTIVDMQWFFDSDVNLYSTNEHGIVVGGMRLRVFDIQPWITKYPLFLYTDTTQLSHGMHRSSGNKEALQEGILLHTKYDSSFISRVQIEVSREEHVHNAREYKAYQNVMDSHDNIEFWYQGSSEFTGLKSCRKLGLIR